MQAILKQSSWLLGAQVISRVIGFFYTIFLARNLGVEDFGLFSVALAYFSLFSGLTDFGFNRFLIRELAISKSHVAKLLTSVTLLRLVLTSIMFGIGAVLFYILDPDKLRVYLILLAVSATLPLAISQTLDGVFVAFRKLQYSAISLVFLSLFTSLPGIILLTFGFSTAGAITALILGQVIYLLTLFIFVKKEHIPLIGSLNRTDLQRVLLGSLPYGILAVMGLIYFKIDTILLSYLRGNYDTGIYGAAFKFLEASILIPGAFANALFPILARLHRVSKEAVRKLYFKSLKVMLVLGVIVLLCYLFVLPPLIRLFLPNYILAIQAVLVLSLSIPFLFLHVPGTQVLLSSDKYLKSIIALSFLTISFNVVLNLIFIPEFGFMAAAWVTVASEALSFVIFFWFLVRRVFK